MRDDFLTGLLDDLEDPVSWRVFADWLEENESDRPHERMRVLADALEWVETLGPNYADRPEGKVGRPTARQTETYYELESTYPLSSELFTTLAILPHVMDDGLSVGTHLSRSPRLRGSCEAMLQVMLWWCDGGAYPDNTDTRFNYAEASTASRRFDQLLDGYALSMTEYACGLAVVRAITCLPNVLWLDQLHRALLGLTGNHGRWLNQLQAKFPKWLRARLPDDPKPATPLHRRRGFMS